MPYVLIVEDDADTRAMLSAVVRDQQLTCDEAEGLEEARRYISRRVPDLILCDLLLPDGSGMALFDDLPSSPQIEVVLTTGHASVDSAVDALRHGATDYLVKPINMKRLQSILARVPRTEDLRAQIAQLRSELQRLGRFGRMRGHSPPMQQLYSAISRVAPTEASVLLIGESGTGKELAAQTVHDLSLRCKAPFLAINCGAIAANLVESEMFGHDRGSFTGAERQHRGFFERASGGTLFLDEITEMPPDTQVKLLRVLETGTIMRVGASQEISVDVRIIAATNRNIDEAVDTGKLRADLYHRLNVFPLSIPPLRERGDDICLIATAFLEELNETYGTRKRFSDAALDAMCDYAWPGNVRELRNYVQRACILCDGPLIEMGPGMAPDTDPWAGAHDDTVTVPLGTAMEEVDRQLILGTLEQCGGVKKRAAEILDISLKTLHNRLESMGHEDKPPPIPRT